MRPGPPRTTSASSGRYNQQRSATTGRRRTKRPPPPVWIPGGGSVETWQWCAQMDYVYAYLSYFGFKDGRATMHGFWEEMDRLGQEPKPHRAGLFPSVGVAASREEAMRLHRAAPA